MSNEEKSILIGLLLDIRDGRPKQFPETYRQGYSDGIFAAIQLLRNSDMIFDKQ